MKSIVLSHEGLMLFFSIYVMEKKARGRQASREPRPRGPLKTDVCFRQSPSQQAGRYLRAAGKNKLCQGAPDIPDDPYPKGGETIRSGLASRPGKKRLRSQLK